jgi:5-methylcytosine-specific restriction enzyme A
VPARGHRVKRTEGPKRTAMKSRYRKTGPSDEVVDLVYERAQWSCEIDGAQVGDRRGTDHHIHHRRPRRMGGSQLPDTNAPQNLLLLCPSCHETVESERTAAYGGGWLVRQNWDPARTPVLVLAKAVFLTADGKYSDDPPADSLPERAS